MKNVYLIKEEVLEGFKHLLEKESLKFESIVFDENSQYVVVNLILDENTLDEEGKARKLDELDKKSFNEYKGSKLKVINSESSAYFTKRLYPLFSDFEHKLRQFITIAFAKAHALNNVNDIPSDLDKKDLGTIHTDFFTDKNFIDKAIKAVTNNPTEYFVNTGKKFTKDELINCISQIPEDSPWSNIGDGNAIPTLKNNYKKMKNYRNDVMHLHYISADTYDDCIKLCKKIEKELDEELDKLTNKNYQVKQSAFNITNQLTEQVKNFILSTNFEEISKAIITNNENNMQEILMDQLKSIRYNDTNNVKRFNKLDFTLTDHTLEKKYISLDELVKLSETDKLNFHEPIILNSNNKSLLVYLNPSLSDKEWDEQALGDWITSSKDAAKIRYIIGVSSLTKLLVCVVKVNKHDIIGKKRIRFNKEKVIYLSSEESNQANYYYLKESINWDNQNPIKYL